ncbi:hypothetical protein Tco_0052753 [Tanacetum coccineum]
MYACSRFGSTVGGFQRHRVRENQGVSVRPRTTGDSQRGAIEITPDDDASELGSGAKTLTKGSGSTKAKGFTSIECSDVTLICTKED